MEASALSSTHILQALRGPLAEEVNDAMVVAGAGQKRNEMSALEADSDDSDEEDEVFIPTSLLDRWVEPRFTRISSPDSPRVLAERKASSEHAQPSSCDRSCTTEPPNLTAARNEARRDGERCTDDLTTKLDSISGSVSGKLTSPDSSHHQPWLNLIPTAPSELDIPHTKHPALAAMTAAASLSSASVAEIEEMMQRASTENAQPAMIDKPLFGVDKEEESAGSRIRYELLPPDLSETVFDKLNEEVDWQKMYHLVGEVPRLVCCQGTMGDDGSMPIYRHPSDHIIPLQRWTGTVNMVRKAAEKIVGHQLNHVLIQLYRSGTDYISEHSDKTLDIVPGSNIVNVSFGAQRTMRLRTKRGATTPDGARVTYRVPTAHNSMIIMSLKTNAQYLHGINADKRPRCELVESEMAFAGQRISCTFRQIGTFISKDSSIVWGQGAVGKTRQEAQEVINGDVDESEKLVRAFGNENAASTIEWQQIYGQGFDVLHLKAIQGQRVTASTDIRDPQ